MDKIKSENARRQWAARRKERSSHWQIEDGTVHISMTRGLEALIDFDDFERVRLYTWVPRFSHTRKSDGVSVYYAEAVVPNETGTEKIFLHNLVMPPTDGMRVDHRDRDGLNCRKGNLRFGTESQNSANKSSVRTIRKYRGVVKDNTSKNWIAKIMVNGKYICKCGLPTAEAAARAYNDLALSHFGEFAMLNTFSGVV